MIWITGCNGMLGTQLCLTLAEKKFNFVKTGREVDVTNFLEVESFGKKILSSGEKISFIINCAAWTDVNGAENEQEKALALNEKAPENLARFAKENKAVLIHISTDYVFDGNKISPYTEEDKTCPVNFYGKSKSAGEEKVIETTQQFYILRTSWLYGLYGKNFVYTMLNLMEKKSAIKVINTQKGCPTSCTTLSNVIALILEKKNVPFGIYNVTDSGEISWWDFAQEIKASGIKLGILKNTNCKVDPCSSKEYFTPAKRPEYSVLSIEKIQQTLGIKMPYWKDSLLDFLKQPFLKTKLTCL